MSGVLGFEEASLEPARAYAFERRPQCQASNMRAVYLRSHPLSWPGVGVKDPLRREGDRPRPSPGSRAGFLLAISPLVRLGSGRGATALQQSRWQGYRVRDGRKKPLLLVCVCVCHVCVLPRKDGRCGAFEVSVLQCLEALPLGRSTIPL